MRFMPYKFYGDIKNTVSSTCYCNLGYFSNNKKLSFETIIKIMIAMDANSLYKEKYDCLDYSNDSTWISITEY